MVDKKHPSLDFIFTEGIGFSFVNLGVGGVFSLCLLTQFGYVNLANTISVISYAIMAALSFIFFTVSLLSLFCKCDCFSDDNIDNTSNIEQRSKMNNSMQAGYGVLLGMLAHIYITFKAFGEIKKISTEFLCIFCIFVFFQVFKLLFVKQAKKNYTDNSPSLEVRYSGHSLAIRASIWFIFILLEVAGMSAMLCNTNKISLFNTHSSAMIACLSVALLGVLGIAIQTIYYLKADSIVLEYASPISFSTMCC